MIGRSGADPGVWQGLARGVAGVAGWRRLALAFALGTLTVAGLPPVHAVFLLPVAFTGLLWQLDGAPRRRTAFAIGWWFGFGYFVAGLYWIAFALLTDPERYGWMIPFAVGGLSAGLAFYPAAAALLVRAIAPAGAGRVLVLAAAWAAMEWLRGILFTGFPWNPIGSVWSFSPAMMQLAAVTGVFGLGLITVAAAAAPATLAGDGRRRWVAPAAAAAVLVAMWGGGEARLASSPSATVPGVLLRIVQANVAQNHKWRDDLRAKQFAKYLKLSSQPSERRVSHVIWPETAAPFFLAKEAEARRLMGRTLPDRGLLITGTLRTTPERPFRVWNSLQAVDARGAIVGSYDKFHLVPFGEYVPFRALLKFAKITQGETDFSTGPGPRTLTLPGLPPVGPLICYEAIFPAQVTDGRDRPAWLLNVTNDAWFGVSSGPYQHFASARMRAVEEGLPLVRAANTGISGIVDAYGRVTARLGIGVEGVIDARLPVGLPETIFAKWGNAVFAMMVVVALLAGAAMRPAGRPLTPNSV